MLGQNGTPNCQSSENQLSVPPEAVKIPAGEDKGQLACKTSGEFLKYGSTETPGIQRDEYVIRGPHSGF